jgi:hypothetical protein
MTLDAKDDALGKFGRPSRRWPPVCATNIEQLGRRIDVVEQHTLSATVSATTSPVRSKLSLPEALSCQPVCHKPFPLVFTVQVHVLRMGGAVSRLLLCPSERH